MPHLKTPRENFDWRNVDFIWLNSPHYIKNDGHANKAINMPDHVDLINIHWIQKFQWPYRNQDVPHSQVVYYHQRTHWIAYTGAETNNTESITYQKYLKSLFNEDAIKRILNNYQDVMSKIEQAIGRKPYPFYENFKVVGECIKNWRFNGECSPYVLCYQKLWNVTEWVYANPSNFEANDLKTL
uniref:Uncharacterized protein n=1 Tax=Acrobeloides nanus TaxID=290746 RepID=A0A914EG91_9BILA